ncbi:bacillithiol system redox-active protein YtxJ [Sediminicola arcticus]|jgi:bacillithiol system protein YtxJ|uniref:Bacillithiol system redox-active protein YtxJ n=1 Tax=Sediminicola arcticus TaxID=1574308 RepID=A0ABV2STC1_9FLAO
MGLLNNIFGNKNSIDKKVESDLPWIALVSLSQLEEIETKSANRVQVIFKHSTTCGISRMVMNMFKSSYNYSENQIDLYYLDLLSFREVSNGVAEKFKVMHQSPQLLVIRNGSVVAHDSHGSINEISLEKYL